MTDVLHPPPETAEEDTLARRARSEAEIRADLAAVPEPRVTCRRCDVDEIAALGWPVVLARGISQSDYGEYRQIWAGIAARDAAMAAKLFPRSEMADVSAAMTLHKVGAIAPFRSHIQETEGNNHDFRYRADTDGRHFTVRLTLSGPMMAALQKVLPVGGKGRTSHILCVSVTDRLRPRDLPLSSDEPYLKHTQRRLRQLVFCDISGERVGCHLVEED